MQFTAAQQATFKAWLTANAAGLIDQDAANLANAAVLGPYFVWGQGVSRSKIDAVVNKAQYTPGDPIPSGPSTDLTYSNRAFLCQLKQMNCQWLTQGTGNLDCSQAQVRQNFKDCLTAIPAGASGANVDAGWLTGGNPGAVRTAMMVAVSNVEKLYVVLATGQGNDGVSGNRGTNTNPDNYGTGQDGLPMIGPVTAQQVAEVRQNG